MALPRARAAGGAEADDGADGLAASQRGWARRVRDACGGWAGSLGDVEADRRALAGTVA